MRSAYILALAALMQIDAADAPITGSYELEGDPAASQRIIDTAINSATERMGFPTKGVARRRLTKKNELAQHIDIEERPNGRVRVTFDRKRIYTTRADGSEVNVELPDGERVYLSHRLDGNRLEQRFESEDGVRINVFERAGDGLVMRVTVESGKLSHPMEYELRYRLVPQETSGSAPN